MAEQASIHNRRIADGTEYLASNDPSLVSHAFVTAAYASDSMYWTTPLTPESIALMLRYSSVLGIYRISADAAAPGQQVGMARFITDHVKHTYLTDVFVLPELWGKGFGTWLVECWDGFLAGMPALRKAMLCTNDGEEKIEFYPTSLHRGEYQR